MQDLEADRDTAMAFHRYCLNYINALNYLESLRKHDDFNEYEKVRNTRWSFELCKPKDIFVPSTHVCGKRLFIDLIDITDISGTFILIWCIYSSVVKTDDVIDCS